ncbi:MAG: hypothetical protein RRX92_08090 [Lachnospiraceae bacterium]
MRNFIKKLFLISFITILCFCILRYPVMALSFSSCGLKLWFSKMIPTLLPFMILTTLLIHLNLHQSFVGFFVPVLQPIFRLSRSCLYAIVVGFCCGFPMGAKVVADLYLSHCISKSEAEYLLSFCNNIGPIYFVSFVLLSFHITNYVPYLFGMYGIPLCYGLALRYLVYRHRIPFQKSDFRHPCPAADRSAFSGMSVFQALDDAIMNALQSIGKLGGYMILCNLCVCIPYLIGSQNAVFTSFSYCILEITGGINHTLTQALSQNIRYLIVFPLLLLGGVSCLLQTASILHGTNLSCKKYCLHKLVQYFFSLLYYACLISCNQITL